MRVREGDFLYEIQPVRDSTTLLLAHYRVFVLMTCGGEDTVLFETIAATFDHATIIAEGALKIAQSQAANRNNAA